MIQIYKVTPLQQYYVLKSIDSSFWFRGILFLLRYYRNYPNCVRRKSTTYHLMFLYFYVSYQKLGWRSPYCLVQNISNFFFVELLFFPSHFELSIQARFKIIMILTKFTHKIKSQNKQRIFSSHHLRWKVISHIYPTMHRIWYGKEIVCMIHQICEIAGKKCHTVLL